MAGTVYADKGLIETYQPNEVFDLGIHLSNTTSDVTGANCSIQIRNSSYGVLVDDTMNEIGGGWYNYTYNTTTLGRHYCRQNCTKGGEYTAETCDFIIGEDDKMLLGVIVLIPLFIAGFLFFLAWFLPEKQWALKTALPLIALTFVYTAYHFAVIAISEFYGSNNLINAIGDNIFIFGWILWVLIAITIIKLVYDVFMLFKDKKEKEGIYNEYEER